MDAGIAPVGVERPHPFANFRVSDDVLKTVFKITCVAGFLYALPYHPICALMGAAVGFLVPYRWDVITERNTLVRFIGVNAILLLGIHWQLGMIFFSCAGPLWFGDRSALIIREFVSGPLGPVGHRLGGDPVGHRRLGD